MKKKKAESNVMKIMAIISEEDKSLLANFVKTVNFNLANQNKENAT